VADDKKMGAKGAQAAKEEAGLWGREMGRVDYWVYYIGFQRKSKREM
jgi:hypothetical protein